MGEHYDIAVIGSGPGGYIAALKAAQMGARAAVVEKEHLGGTCLNYGCIPSKALLASAELMHRIAHAGQFGVEAGGKASCNWGKVQSRKDKIVDTLRRGIQSLLAARKVGLYRGRGVLNGPGKIAVTRDDGADRITAEKVILAFGSVPSRIPGFPDDPQRVCTSDEALHWKDLPRRLLIVGGGAIGCEFACMMAAFGVEVSLVEMLPSLLPNMDADLGAALEKILAKRGIQIFTDAKVENLSVTGEAISATRSGGKMMEVDRLLVATGRRANTSDVGLETVGLQTDRGFLRVDDRMATPVKDHYCIGDANGRCLLAHAASAQGVVAVANALGGGRSFDLPVPEAVYTFPEVAAVGLTPQRAKAEGIPVAVGLFPMGHLGKAMAVGETEGFVKVLRHRESGALLGVHMLGHNVTECIAAAGAMLGQKVAVGDVAETVIAHPTMSEALKEAAGDALGMALHLPPRKVLRVTAG